MSGFDQNKNHIGLMAQELQKIAPNLVSDWEKSDLDTKTGLKKNKKTYLKINDTAIKYMLINAIKDQQSLITNLESRLSELESIIGSINLDDRDNYDIRLSSPENSELSQNRPNPFQESTQIDFNINANAKSARIDFYSLSGQLIKSIKIDPSKGTMNVRGTDLKSGTYTYNLVVDNQVVDSKKMSVLR
jgi:hypothetical protein